VEVSLGGEGLRCEIVGLPEGAGGQYGGVKFRARPFQALGLEVTFLNPENIEAVYLDGCRASGDRVVRWQWQVTDERRPAGSRAVYLFVPGMPSGYFVPAERCDTAAVEEVEFFVRIRPSSQAGFVVHRAGIVGAK
jgi:hypothetical protein